MTSPTLPDPVKEALALASCVSGTLLCSFEEFHEKAESLLGRPVMTHEFADKETVAELKERGLVEMRRKNYFD